MAKNKKEQQSVNNKTDNKQRKGDTSRTSSQGQKLASGGSKQTDNRGHQRQP
jgi:hypothetical protein